MPTIPPAGAFLTLFNPSNWQASHSHASNPDTSDSDPGSDASSEPTTFKDHGPFSWPTWQARTGFMSPIFSRSPHSGTPRNWQSKEDNDAVWSFVTKFWSLPQVDKVTYIRRGRADNDSRGRILYLDWFKAVARKWAYNTVILSSLSDCKVDPYSTLKQMDGSTKMPHFDQSQAYLAYGPIAHSLFGPEAFQSGQILKRSVQQCTYELTLDYWHHQTRRVEQDWSKLEVLKDAVENSWKHLSSEADKGKRPTAEDFRAWLKNVGSLIGMLDRRGDKDSVASLKHQRARLKEILAGLGIGPGSKRGKNIVPKALRDALSFLATAEQVNVLVLSLQEELANSDSSDDSDDQLHDLDLDRPDVEWAEGVEEYSNTPPDELWAMLGRPEMSIPFFNPKQDPENKRDPWTPEGSKWLQDPSNGVPLMLRWHQLVGVLKMVENAFAKRPVLLMDGVGLGKTIQVAAFIAVLAWFREYFAVHGKFPGKFADKKWDSPTGNIPDLPSVIAVPATLVNQIMRELHVYFEHGTFDVLPLLGTQPKRPEWWSKHYTACENAPGRRILITTPKAAQSDFDAVLEADRMHPTESPKPLPSFAEHSPSTLYGHEFLVTVVDEAHQCRNLNKAFFSLFGLMERSRCRIALTATPIISCPQDVWNLGRLLLIDSFSSPVADEEYHKMDSKLRKSIAMDRKRLRQSGAMDALIKANVKGQAEREPVSAYGKEMRKAIKTIRVRYAGAIIRRTLRSVDYAGQRISGLEPFMEHFIRVSLYPHEMANLESVAQGLIEDSHRKRARRSDFYLKVRRALIHPSCNLEYSWKSPSTLDEWRKDPSRKMDLLAEILLWHLARDGQPPLMAVDDKLVPSKRKLVRKQAEAGKDAPDKMVVFCEFVSAFELIRDILKLHNIPIYELHGDIPIPQRPEITERFAASTRDGPRVLLMTTVGLVGLNLPCSNILVKVTQNWSVHDDDQLIGRIYRHPQSKPVHVYSLVANDTQDVFLNHIAFSKGEASDAFTNTTPSMKALFGNEDEAEEDDQAATGDMAKRRKGKAAEGSPVDSSTKLKEGRRSKANECKGSTTHGDEDDISSEVKSKRSKKGKVLSLIDGVNGSKRQNDEEEGGDAMRKAKGKTDGDDRDDDALRKEKEKKKKKSSGGEGDDRDGDVLGKSKKTQSRGDDRRKEKKRKRVEEEVESSGRKLEMQSGGGEGDSLTKVKKRKLSKDDPSTVHGSCGGEGVALIKANKGKQRKKDEGLGKSGDDSMLETQGGERDAPRKTKKKQDGNHIKSGRGLDEGGDGESRERDASRKAKKRKRDQEEGERDLDEGGGDDGLAVQKRQAEDHGSGKTKKNKKKKQKASHVGGDVPEVFSFQTMLEAPEFSELAHMVLAGEE